MSEHHNRPTHMIKHSHGNQDYTETTDRYLGKQAHSQQEVALDDCTPDAERTCQEEWEHSLSPAVQKGCSPSQEDCGLEHRR